MDLPTHAYVKAGHKLKPFLQIAAVMKSNMASAHAGVALVLLYTAAEGCKACKGCGPAQQCGRAHLGGQEGPTAAVWGSGSGAPAQSGVWSGSAG